MPGREQHLIEREIALTVDVPSATVASQRADAHRGVADLDPSTGIVKQAHEAIAEIATDLSPRRIGVRPGLIAIVITPVLEALAPRRPRRPHVDLFGGEVHAQILGQCGVVVGSGTWGPRGIEEPHVESQIGAFRSPG